jgi:phosphate butyryltransferase
MSKALIEMAGATMAGMVVGAKVPIVLTSRGASSEEKYLSLVLSASAVK